MKESICTAEDCDGRVVARAMCGKHYQRWVKAGKPGYVPKSEIPVVLCAADNCSRPAKSRGYCNRHYENLRRYGNPIPQRDRALAERIKEVGWTQSERGCWEWKGKRNDFGYGIFSAERLGFEGSRAHRVVYEHFVGAIPDGLLLRHRCDNPPCVNPDHLVPGTPADNMRDMVERGRHWRHGRSECDKGHDLTVDGATRSFKREWGTETICVECDRARKQRHARKKRAA